ADRRGAQARGTGGRGAPAGGDAPDGGGRGAGTGGPGAAGNLQDSRAQGTLDGGGQKGGRPSGGSGNGRIQAAPAAGGGKRRRVGPANGRAEGAMSDFMKVDSFRLQQASARSSSTSAVPSDRDVDDFERAMRQ